MSHGYVHGLHADENELNESDDIPCYLTPEARDVRELGTRLVTLQQPLRLLSAIRWSHEVEERFFARGARELPEITYAELPFDPAAKHAEFRQWADDCRRRLGASHPAARIMLHQGEGFRGIVDLLASRGQPEFSRRSAELFGTPESDGGRRFQRLIESRDSKLDDPLPADAARCQLAERFERTFSPRWPVRVEVTSELNANAAAIGVCVRLRETARFTLAELAALEVHEGWVHLGTTVNARAQTVCPFLTVVSPAATRTQEGLAVLAELLAGVAHEDRLQRLARRYRAVLMAVHGANFLDIYRYFLVWHEPAEAFRQSARVFRGSRPDAGPFTKDATYILGLLALAASPSLPVPLLMAGKTALEWVPELGELAERGLLSSPEFMPPAFDLTQTQPRLTHVRSRLKFV